MLNSMCNEKKIALGVYVDLSKAFDSIDHSILLYKLAKYGIRGVAHKWFGSYLQNRKQCVQYKNTTSNLMPVSIGVPQGSILGPLLFLVFVNDLINVSKTLSMILYADDTNIFLSDTNLDNLICKANNELKHRVNWFKANKLQLNASKTKFMLYNVKNIDTLQINYDRIDKFINRACGYRANFILEPPSAIILNSGNNWIKGFIILKDTVSDEKAAHLGILH